MSKNVNGDLVLDCFSCAHSQQGADRTSHSPRLVCSLSLMAATERCSEFCYIPGSDQGEIERNSQTDTGTFARNAGISRFIKKESKHEGSD